VGAENSRSAARAWRCPVISGPHSETILQPCSVSLVQLGADAADHAAVSHCFPLPGHACSRRFSLARAKIPSIGLDSLPVHVASALLMRDKLHTAKLLNQRACCWVKLQVAEHARSKRSSGLRLRCAVSGLDRNGCFAFSRPPDCNQDGAGKAYPSGCGRPWPRWLLPRLFVLLPK
jgi:hypothetical protein